MLQHAFWDYLSDVRASPARPFLHYNSWFDFYSWQEPNATFADRAMDERWAPNVMGRLLACIQAPALCWCSKRRRHATDLRSANDYRTHHPGFAPSICTERVNAFGTEFVQKRGVTFDSFLWDDGYVGVVWESRPARVSTIGYRPGDPHSDRCSSVFLGGMTPSRSGSSTKAFPRGFPPSPNVVRP